jgi:glutamyl-tRNA synthetase
MHIGNVRAALFNALLARQLDGRFILRIEDTDAQRNVSEGTEHILTDLAWLGLTPEEGPGSSTNEPYFQSQRQEVYIRALARLIDRGYVYRCFCTPERLQLMRQEQRQAGLPPRYDNHCRDLTEDELHDHAGDGTPFIWRFRRPETATFTLQVEPGGTMDVDMRHFADFALTRADESFTFLFTNVVDDIEMNISHVIRGQDHQSNAALQAALYHAFDAPVPVFIHLPLLCGPGGKKLSKRDDGFSLAEVQAAGILPEALTHYLLTLGSTTIDHVMSDDELLRLPLLDRLSSSMITYDLSALRAINRKYLGHLSGDAYVAALLTFDAQFTKELQQASATHLLEIAAVLRQEVATLSEAVALIARVLHQPVLDRTALLDFVRHDDELLRVLIGKAEELFAAHQPTAALAEYKVWAKSNDVPMKTALCTLRYLLVGVFTGYAMGELIQVLPIEDMQERIAAGIQLLVGS